MEMSFAKHYRNRLSQYYLARAGIVMAFAELNRDSSISVYSALKDGWSNSNPPTNTPENIFNNRTLGNGSFNVSYEYNSGLMVYNTMSGDQPITNTFCGLIDEERKINVNAVSQNVLRNLFQQVANLQANQAESLAACVKDWTSTNMASRQFGAKNDYYQTLPNSYDCKNAPLDRLEELLLVKGMTPAIFESIKDYITIYGNGRVNINTAPYNVLISLGILNTLATKIINCRAGADEVEGTEDDMVFTSATAPAIRAVLSARQTLTAAEETSLNQSIRHIAVTSNHFRVISTGTLNDQSEKNSTKITCIISRNGKIVYWHEEVGENRNPAAAPESDKSTD
jgi:hypothetical protein